MWMRGELRIRGSPLHVLFHFMPFFLKSWEQKGALAGALSDRVCVCVGCTWHTASSTSKSCFSKMMGCINYLPHTHPSMLKDMCHLRIMFQEPDTLAYKIL